MSIGAMRLVISARSHSSQSSNGSRYAYLKEIFKGRKKRDQHNRLKDRQWWR